MLCLEIIYRKQLEIGGGSFPIGHSLIIGNDTEKPKKLQTFSVPRSSLFDSLNSFLPQFKSSCEEVQREFAETGTTHYSVEELVSDSDEESVASNETDSSDAMADSPSVPTVEMRLAVAPMEAIEAIEKAEDTLAEPSIHPPPNPQQPHLIHEL